MGDQDNSQLNEYTFTQPIPSEDLSTSQSQNQDVGGEANEATASTSQPEPSSDNVFQITIQLPHQPYQIPITVSTQEQVQDIRQTIMETPGAIQYSCFHLEFNSKRVNDFAELSEVAGVAPDSEMTLVEDPYTQKEARLHLLRCRELIGISNEKVDGPYGVAAGSTLHDSVCPWTPSESTGPSISENKLIDFSFDEEPQIHRLVVSLEDLAPKTIKSLNVSAWNPPPPHLRQQGHLIYLQLTTNEGEQFQITSHVTGFFVNRSSASKFDPSARLPPKNASAHSLFTLIQQVSPSFEKAFGSLLEMNSKRDPLTNFQLTNAIPASSWLVSPAAISLTNHHPDIARSQEAYLLSGPDGNETLRDWNEELQSTRELPRETVQERVFRERLIAKTYAEFTDAAVKGAILVARGEVAPLNPTESTDAQIFVYNNVFYSFGADGVGTFASEGGDEAARVAVGKDVMGVQAVNQLDVKGLATAGTIIVDYLDKRIVAQSIVPGIFKQREPDEHQVDYGGVEGRDVVADNAEFVPTFSQISKLLKVKRHPVWDKDGKRHDLEASVETKGLLGTDGRKYILDLYRLTPLDISWIEHQGTNETGDFPESKRYPHRMTVLRPELIDSYWRLKMGEFVQEQIKQRQEAAASTNRAQDSTKPEKALTNGEHDSSPTDSDQPAHRERKDPQDGANAHSSVTANQAEKAGVDQERVDISSFSFALNPDMFCGQRPHTDEERAELAQDEAEIRAVCDHFHQVVFPEFLHDLREAEIGFPMDGISLSSLLHKRGINVRYLGKLATIADDNARGRALKSLAEQEMIARGFKHEAYRYLKGLPGVFTATCIAHLLNCLLGKRLNDSPTIMNEGSLKSLYPNANFLFYELTPHALAEGIKTQVQRRYRYDLPNELVVASQHIQILRSVCLKLGIQLICKDYNFGLTEPSVSTQETPMANGASIHVVANGRSTSSGVSKKKKKGNARVPARTASPLSEAPVTFHPDDVVNVVPVIKDSSPKSILAAETLEAGKFSMMQNQKEIGQDLLLESLTLHEQIYGVLHPEVARVYHQLAMLYSQLDEKAAAIELAHKAVIISERTLGIDSSETVLNYLNLALFEHGNHNTSVAVSCLRHALELWNIIYGHNHPDVMTTLNNAAVMLQHPQTYKQSRLWFEKSLNISEEMSGRSSVSTATLLFQLAHGLVLEGDHKGAVNRMREAYNIFRSKLGPEHVNTKESEKWLEQITQSAVTIAKHAKDVQAKRTRRIQFNPRIARLGTDLQPQFGQAQSNLVNGNETRNPSALDSRNIDELIKFIEGKGDVNKTPASKKKGGRGNPRRRGGASIGSTA